MHLSTRLKFREGQNTWQEFVSHSGLDYVKEVRSADPHINDYVFVDGSACPYECTATNLFEVLSKLPRIGSPDHYYQLGINLRSENIPKLPPSASLLGFDVLNDDMDSLTLALGILPTYLPDYLTKANSFALFSRSDAEEIVAELPPLLPELPKDPENIYSVWAVYEIELET